MVLSFHLELFSREFDHQLTRNCSENTKFSGFVQKQIEKSQDRFSQNVSLKDLIYEPKRIT